VITAATAGGRQAPLGGHLWHTIEAIGFLAISLGGIAVAEFVQARRRRNDSRAPLGSAAPEPGSAARTQGAALTAGSGSAIALLPARTQVETTAASVGPTSVGGRSTLLPLVALAGAAAACVHFVVMPEHFEESALYGAFFAVAATSQLVYSLMLLARPSRSLLVAGALGNITIVGLWLVTRTIGIPLGPAAGTTESVGGLDVLATIFELTTAIGAILLIRRRGRLTPAIRPSSWSPLIRALGPAAAVAIAATAYISPPS
jgi:hypothetical protein